MSFTRLPLAIGWPGAATHADAPLLRVGWGDFVALIPRTDLVAMLLTMVFLVWFVRFAEGVDRERRLELESKILRWK